MTSEMFKLRESPSKILHTTFKVKCWLTKQSIQPWYTYYSSLLLTVNPWNCWCWCTSVSFDSTCHTNNFYRNTAIENLLLSHSNIHQDFILSLCFRNKCRDWCWLSIMMCSNYFKKNKCAPYTVPQSTALTVQCLDITCRWNICMYYSISLLVAGIIQHLTILAIGYNQVPTDFLPKKQHTLIS